LNTEDACVYAKAYTRVIHKHTVYVTHIYKYVIVCTFLRNTPTYTCTYVYTRTWHTKDREMLPPNKKHIDG